MKRKPSQEEARKLVGAALVRAFAVESGMDDGLANLLALLIDKKQEPTR